MVNIIKCFKYINLAYIQYDLHNAQDNNNFESDILLDINLSGTFLYVIIYLKVMLDFILKIVNLYKKIKKHVLIRQTNIVKRKINTVNINILLQTFI